MAHQDLPADPAAPGERYWNVRCDNCGDGLVEVGTGRTVLEAWESLQAADALWIELAGAYGMYFDALDDDLEPMLFCRVCADRLRSLFPGFEAVLRPLAGPIRP